MPKTYSHSKLSTFEQCRLKYKFKYVDKIKIITKSIEALLGFCVHAVLEYLYNEVKTGRIPSIDEIITVYDTMWKENYDDNLIIIVRQGMTKEDYFNKGVQFLVDYYTRHHPFDDNTLEIEKKVEIILDEEKQIKIIGYIDRLVHNITTDELEIHDYKTSNTLPIQEDIENNRQLALYSIAIKEEFGHDKEVCLVWHFLAHNKKICSYRSREQIELLKKEILELISKIESEKFFQYNKTNLCDWCEYKAICPAWS